MSFQDSAKCLHRIWVMETLLGVLYPKGWIKLNGTKYSDRQECPIRYGTSRISRIPFKLCTRFRVLKVGYQSKLTPRVEIFLCESKLPKNA